MKWLTFVALMVFSLTSTAQAALIQLEFTNGWVVNFDDTLTSSSSVDNIYGAPSIGGTAPPLVNYVRDLSLTRVYHDGGSNFQLKFVEQYAGYGGPNNYNLIFASNPPWPDGAIDLTSSLDDILTALVELENVFGNLFSTRHFDSRRLVNPEIDFNSTALVSWDYVDSTPDPIPEPTTMLLLGTGLVGVAGAARRRKKNQT